MADALCGPSNPLQTFQKQTSLDRTLQQDRLGPRQAQAETFRTVPGPNAGALDAEFEAFQSSHPVETGYLEPELFPFGRPATSFQANSPQDLLESSEWASQFSGMPLSQARSYLIEQSQSHQHAPTQHSRPLGWHEEFLHLQNQTCSHQPQRTRQPAINWAYGYTGGLVPQQTTMLSPVAQQKQPERQADDTYDEAAFEKAFEDARLDSQQDTQLDQDFYRTEEAGNKLVNPLANNDLEHERIGSDRILDEAENTEEKSDKETEADELARTAGQLLENVKDDQSRKFQESNFLSLMRQLRDKEVRVEGDTLVDVSMPSSTT